MARNDMLRTRHPATADEAFSTPRRRFAPRAIGLFVGGQDAEAVGQTFRPPAEGTSLRLTSPNLEYRHGTVSLFVYELDGLKPNSGRRVLEGILDDASPELRIEPALPLKADRLYSFVLRLDPAFGDWQPRVGDPSFRLGFDGPIQ